MRIKRTNAKEQGKNKTNWKKWREKQRIERKYGVTIGESVNRARKNYIWVGAGGEEKQENKKK